MSGELDLSFSHHGDRDAGELPVVVDVVDANLEAAAQPRLVRLAGRWRQDLEPGTYLVRVRFPSGQEIRRTCTVRNGDRTPVSVDLHYLAGHESLERSAVLRRVVRDEGSPGLADTRLAAAWARRWTGTSSGGWQQIDFNGTPGGGDDYAVQYRFDFAGLQPSVLQLGGPRIAWRFVSLPPVPAVEVTVSPRGEDDLAVEVTTGSIEAEALLGYLRTGAVEGADMTAESLLRKQPGPIAGAIGGYYLLRTANLERLSEWGPYLSRRFPQLADGAVINAWQHIHAGREHRGDPDGHFDAARQQLILAAQRGVPVYTEGLRLLVDGLHLIREDAEAEDGKLNDALAFIEPFAGAADWSAATVTYSGTDPAKPRSRRRYGTPKDQRTLVLLRPHSRPIPVPPVAFPPVTAAGLLPAAHVAPANDIELARALDRAAALARELTRLVEEDNLTRTGGPDRARVLTYDLARVVRDFRGDDPVPADDLDRARILALDLRAYFSTTRYLADRFRDPHAIRAIRAIRASIRARELAVDLVETLMRAQELTRADRPSDPGSEA